MTAISKEMLKKYRLKNWLEQQAEVVDHLLDENTENILYMAPAARGKTLPPLLTILEQRKTKPRKMTVWFMPTIALAHDFIYRIEPCGNYRRLLPDLKDVRYYCFTGASLTDKAEKKISIARKGDPDLLIVSPESLRDPAFLAWLLDKKRNIGQIVLDEAHLFDEWGITFRRAYFIISWLIGTLRKKNVNMKVIALSASLPEDKRETVMKLIHFEDGNTFVSRPKKIHIGSKIVCHSVWKKKEKEKMLAKVLKKELGKKNDEGRKARGVLFSLYKKKKSRGKILDWSVKNMELGIVPKLGLREDEYALYSGSTGRDEKERILHDLQSKNGKIRLLLATDSFGFGVDVHSLDFSVNIQVPQDLDRFYQEISRCSRKPMRGSSHLFYSPYDVAVETKRARGTLTFNTVKSYLEYLGIKKLVKGYKTLNIKKILKKSPADKKFNSQIKAQWSADGYFENAFEAIMFLYRHGVIELGALAQKHFPKKMSTLVNAFERGESSGYRMIKYKDYKVFLPSVKFPVKIVKGVSWSELERWVETDKTARGKRTAIFRKIGKNLTCHWGVIASHYSAEMAKKNGKIVTQCNHCNVCKTSGK